MRTGGLIGRSVVRARDEARSKRDARGRRVQRRDFRPSVCLPSTPTSHALTPAQAVAPALMLMANPSSSSSPTTVHAQTRALLGSLGLLPPSPDAAKVVVARTVRALDRAGGGLRAEWSETLGGLEG